MVNTQYEAVRIVMERVNDGFTAISEEQQRLEALVFKLIESLDATRQEVRALESEMAATRGQIGKLSRSMRRRMFE